MKPVPDGDLTPVRVPVSLGAALGHLGRRHPRLRRLRSLVTRFGDLAALRPAVTARGAEHRVGVGRTRPTEAPRDRARRRGRGAIRRRGPIAVRRGRRRSRCTTPSDGFYAAGGAGRPARRLPHQPRGRPALRRGRGPGARRAGGREPGGPTRSSSSRPAPGPGTLARTVLAAEPACAPALRYVLVERSAALRAATASTSRSSRPRSPSPPRPTRRRRRAGRRPSPRADRREPRRRCPACPVPAWCWPTSCSTTCPFGLLERDRRTGWAEVRVGARRTTALVEVAGARRDRPPAVDGRGRRAGCPRQAGRGAAWVAATRVALAGAGGRVVAFDYAATTARAGRAGRGREWLRTYRGHERGGRPLDAPRRRRTSPARSPSTSCRRPTARPRRQADWLRAHGIDELVDEGRRDLARAGRASATSRRSGPAAGSREAEALLDPTGPRRLPRPRVGRRLTLLGEHRLAGARRCSAGARPASKARMASGRFSVKPSMSWLRSSSSTAASRLATSRLAHSTSLVIARP